MTVNSHCIATNPLKGHQTHTWLHHPQVTAVEWESWDTVFLMVVAVTCCLLLVAVLGAGLLHCYNTSVEPPPATAAATTPATGTASSPATVPLLPQMQKTLAAT